MPTTVSVVRLLHQEDAAGDVRNEPVDAVYEAVARDSAAGDNAPMPRGKLSGAQPQRIRDLGGGKRTRQILLVGENEQRGACQFLENRTSATASATVPPVRANGLLASDVPDVQFEADGWSHTARQRSGLVPTCSNHKYGSPTHSLLVLERLDVEAQRGRDLRDVLAHELLEDRRLAGIVQASARTAVAHQLHSAPLSFVITAPNAQHEYADLLLLLLDLLEDTQQPHLHSLPNARYGEMLKLQKWPHEKRMKRRDREFNFCSDEAAAVMTKALPQRRWLLEKRDGNQEDAHAPEPGARRPKSTCRPTSLEELLDLELDLVLPVTAVAAPMSNQAPVCAAKEDETDVDSVSLELLAMQSPHGENQHWQGEEEEQHAVRSAASVRPEHSPRRWLKDMPAPRKPLPLNLVSPTAFVPSFPPSSGQSSTDDDYGLASPMALPDTPSQTRSGIALAWDLEPPSPTLDDAHTRAGTTRRFVQSKSVQRPERRASASAVATRAATPNPRSHRNYGPDRAASRLTRSSLPTLPEVRAGKARHGGIYSLLLKNKSSKQEPVLVEDTHNPEEVTAALSVAKVSPPRTFGKPKHGGIYKVLRGGHGPPCRNDRTISQHKPEDTQKMNRIFGKKKPEAPPVNISDVGGKVDARVTGLDMKIEKLDQELRKYREQMKKTRGPAVNSIKQRAMQTLKRKKMFEAQRDKLQAQSFNIEQVGVGSLGSVMCAELNNCILPAVGLGTVGGVCDRHIKRHSQHRGCDEERCGATEGGDAEN
ncbi:hypothetical protein ON010_g12338 [Phytophthora cinnamomi]|nr:hypothetical protein ON010_g12338 [Phytophthora cinnamomi]